VSANLFSLPPYPGGNHALPDHPSPPPDNPSAVLKDLRALGSRLHRLPSLGCDDADAVLEDAIGAPAGSAPNRLSLMPRRDRSLPPGLAPRYLSREQAAAYVSVSASVFDAEVRSGQWPLGRRRGAKDGRLTWDRLLLDEYADRHSGIVHHVTPGPGDASEAMTRDAEAEAMERSAHVPSPRNRHQHGRTKAA
jgi:hypothetical protein